jgi:predicted kinase
MLAGAGARGEANSSSTDGCVRSNQRPMNAAAPMTATLNVIFGPSGAGKTTYAATFARREGAVCFILDEWMARLFGPDIPQPVEYDWMVERVGRCEALIWSMVAATMAAGTSVILDLGLMRRADRERIRQIAEAVELPLQWHYVTAPQEVRRARVAERTQVHGANFALQITPDMFEFVEGVFETPSEEELQGAIVSESD